MWSRIQILRPETTEVLKNRLIQADAFRVQVTAIGLRLKRRPDWFERGVFQVVDVHFESTQSGGSIVQLRFRPRVINYIVLLAGWAIIAWGWLTRPAFPDDWFAPWFFAALALLLPLVLLISSVMQVSRFTELLQKTLTQHTLGSKQQ